MSYIKLDEVVVPELPDPNEIIITSDRKMGPRHTIGFTINISDIRVRRYSLIDRYNNKTS